MTPSLRSAPWLPMGWAVLRSVLLSPTMLLFALGCSSAPPTPLAVEVEEKMQIWKQALEARDAPGLAALYQQDAEVVVMWLGAVPGTDGAESITWKWEDESAAQRAFLNGMTELTLSPTEMRVVEIGDDGAAVSITGELVMRPQGQPSSIRLDCRTSLVWHKQNGRWAIVQEHMSANPVPPS